LASDEAAEAAALKACETELLDLPLIELPRLKMSFHTRISDDGECRLYSLDHADLYVSNARSDDLESITAGIPHSLIMSNDMGELSMLVPCVSVVRPSIASSPLSTEIVLERNDLWWNLVLDTRYFIYPIHVSLSFVFTPTLASALYLMLLRLLHRDYAEVFRLADTIGSDSDLSSEERHLLLTLGEANSDTHADACACRIKITLAVMDSQDARLPWAMLPVYSIYSQRISTLSAACRLPLNDEVRFARAAVTPAVCSRLLRFNRACRSVLPPRWVPLAIMAYNRLQCIEAMVYGRPAYRTMTLPVPAVECIYTADLGSVEELLFTSGHEALLSDEVKSHIRGKVVRAFQRPAKQVYRPLRNVASAELLTVAARFLAHSETSGNMANGALGFLYVYQLLQGDVRARAASRECAFGLGVFAASMLPLGRYCRLTALLKLMVQRPDVAQVLPRWSAFCKSNRGSEMTFESSGGNKPVPVEGLADFFKQAIDTLARLYKASPLFVAAPFGHATASAATETIRGQFRAPARVGLVQKVGARSWVTPQLSNYDCSSRYLIAASSAMSDDDPETVSALERHVHLQGLGRKAGDSSVAATLKRALRDWDHLQKKGQRHFSSEYWAQLGSEASRGLQTLVGTVLGDLNVDQEVIKRAFVANRDDTFTELPINVRAHPGVQSGVALAMQSRLEKDMELFVAARNVSSETFVKGLTDSDVSGLVGTGLVPPTVSAAGTVAGLKENFESLVRRMTAVKSDDERAVRHAFGLVKRLSQCTLDVRKSGDAFAERLFGRNSQVAETIASLTADESVAVERHMHHWLLVLAGNEPELQLEYIIGALLSSRAVFDLRKINPFLTDDMITVMFSFVEAALLRANRIGHINRTLGELRSLIKLLDKVNAASSGGASGGQGDAALIAGVVQKSKAVGTHLTAAHHYFTPITAEQAAEQEGVEAVAEITSLAKCGDFLFAAQIPEEHLCGTATADAVANEAAALSHEAAIASWVSSNSESSKSKPLSRNMGLCCVLEAAKIRTLWGHGLRGESIPSFHGSLEKFAHGGAYGVSRAAQAGIILPTGASDKHGAVEYDPRFLVFEFTWNIMLRKSQVAMVRDFADNIRAGKSIVKQMIMGAGKTTVVAPLLTLMFGDGKSLVMEVVPPALLEFSRSIMRSTFSTVMYKRVFTFHFDRATIPHASMLTKLRSAVAARGVVISTPTSVKSVMLKLLETQQHLMDLTLPRTRELEHERDVLVAMLREFQDGVLLMDEVDMILHPLKSELNFPVGAKHELDFDPLRWKLAMHVLDAVYYRSTPVVPADFRDSKAALGLLEQISAAIGTGLLERHMQSSPHTVLLNTDFYYTSILPLMCDWVMLWIEAQHLTGITSAQLREYLMTPGTHGLELASAVEHGVTPHFRKMINLARDWLRSYLPHVLQKIDRVSFGLLSEDDYARAIKNDPNIPETRAKLAIPFLGKDVPSETSEFAHPDVIIGLTYMAYRYEGLRYADFCEIIDSMHSSLSKELGPYLKRPSVLRYARWVHEATGQIRGESPPLVAPLAATAADDEEAVEVIDTRPEVMPLRLLKRSNVDHMQALFDLVIREPLVIQWYLNDFVFPAHLRHQKIKLSASGVEVGGDMLFSRRVGFSGTPSDLLPLELGKCDYEKGTDGMMVHVLTSSQMVGASYVEEDWSVRSLLKRVATQTNPAGEPMFQALIDTGALITGFSNKGVAEYLLEHGLAWADGVVFLDELDRKMVLVRATKRVVKLAQCGIPAEKRFAFYDQVHTTGMDISHRLDACAALTLGKDMTFRDYAQGAYRMRGLSKGQTIHLLVTPEIARLIQRQLELAAGGPRPVIASTVGTPAALLESVVAWLVINAMQSEQTQFNQLAIQNVTNVWRKNAFKDLIANAKYFGLDTFPVDPAVAAEHKAKKTRIARQVAQALKEAGHGDTEDVNKQKRKNERRAAHRRMHKQRLAIRAEFIAKIRADGNSEASFVQNLPEYRKQIEELLRARRKEQFRAAMLGYASDESSIGAASGATAAVQGPAPVEPTVPRNSAIEAALEVFEEDVNFALEEGVPRIVPFNESLQSRIDHNKRFIASSAESAICAETVHSVMRSAGDTLQLLALTAEMVQTVEEERERAVEQEQESEIEVEKFVDQSYARDNEVQTPWPLSLLRHAPNDASHPVEVPPFYSASLFTVPGAAGISLPRSLYISNNYYDRRWTGSRRVKNATMYLEYSPKTGAGAGVLETWLATTGPASLAARLDGPSGVELASQLATAFDLFDIDGSGDLNEEEAAHFVSAVTTERLEHSRSVVAQLFRAMGTASLTRVQVEKLLCEGALHAGEAGRFFICLSLREAESLRWWMHKRAGKGLFDDEDVDIVLRCSANDNSIIDAVHAPYLTLALGAPSPAPVAVVNSVMAATSSLAAAHASMVHCVWQAVRYLNCETYFSTADITTLLSVVDQHDAAARLCTFSAVQACRRRARRKWHETPVARLFNVGYNSRLHALKARAISFRIRHILRERRFSAMDAFRAFDYNHNGLLSPDEFMGGISWLGLDQVVAIDDVVDLIGFSERKDGNLQAKDFGDLLRDPSLADDRVGAAKQHHLQLLQQQQQPGDVPAMPADDEDIGGLDDADLPTVLPARSDDILRAWSSRAVADLVSSTANAGAVPSAAVEESKDVATSEAPTAPAAVSENDLLGVTIGRDELSRQQWIELDFSLGIPQCVKCEGNVTWVAPDAPGNHERVGYLKCSNMGGFVVTIPSVGPFQKYPSSRTMSKYTLLAHIRFPSLPPAKLSDEGNNLSKKVLAKRRPLFSASTKEGTFDIAAASNAAFPSQTNVRCYESHEPLNVNTWEALGHYYCQSTAEVWLAGRIIRHWGTFKNIVHQSFRVGLPADETGKSLGPNESGHEFHIRHLSLRSMGRNQPDLTQYSNAYLKSQLKWGCTRCGVVNSNTTTCAVCGIDKAHGATASAHASQTRHCPLCFHANAPERTACARCNTDLGELQGDDDAGAGAGGVAEAGVDDCDVTSLGIEGDEGDAKSGEGNEGDEGDDKDDAASEQGELMGDDEDDGSKAAELAARSDNAQLKTARNWRGGAVQSLLAKLNIKRTLFNNELDSELDNSQDENEDSDEDQDDAHGESA
jgi:Ca2+-binding EF-hand superfamily protein